MTKNELMTKATRTINRFGLKCKKYSPEVLAVAGTIGVVASAVMACKATLKVNDIVEETQEQLENLHEHGERLESGEVLHTKDGAEYTVDIYKKDLVLVYTQSAIKFIKLYGPAVALGTASLACLLGSNNILKKRNVAIAAAYATVDQGFKEYRGRVIDRFGEELDRELRLNIKPEEVTEIVTNEDGTETEVTTTVNVVDPNNKSPYSVCFCEYSNYWSKDAESNKFFLMQQQNYANDLLKSRGHLFLNEVYDMLGLDRTRAGQQVGWVYNEKNPIGDNFVDFGIFDLDDERKRAFMNGHERSIWLDFNVDGIVMDLLP